jgi:hypothetical protein
MFSQRNQTFRTTDLFVLIVLVGGVASIFGAILAETFHDNRPVKALADAESWARQIQTRQMHQSGGRGPASVSETAPVFSEEGNTGRDPWGRPFHYLVRATNVQGHWRVYVWSDGSNGKSETDPHEFTQLAQATFKAGGDDIAHVEEFTTESESASR